MLLPPSSPSQISVLPKMPGSILSEDFAQKYLHVDLGYFYSSANWYRNLEVGIRGSALGSWARAGTLSSQGCREGPMKG